MEITGAIEAVGNAADCCARVDLDEVVVTDLRASLAEFRTGLSRLEAEFARMTHAADRAGAHIGTGARDTAEWVGQQTGTATRKNRTAAELGEAMAKSTELADAVASERISNDKATAAVGGAGGLALDAELVDAIGDLPLNSVRPAAESWRARHDAEHEATRAERQRARRFLKLTGQADGMTRVEGLLDPDSAAIVRTTLDGVMNESAFDESGRRRDQRCADAFVQLAKAASKGNIVGGRSNAKVLATVPFETITERGTARGLTHPVGRSRGTATSSRSIIPTGPSTPAGRPPYRSLDQRAGRSLIRPVVDNQTNPSSSRHPKSNHPEPTRSAESQYRAAPPHLDN